MSRAMRVMVLGEGANAIIAAARGERILSKPRRPISETHFSLLAWEGHTAQQMWACASKRPSAGGNIGARRRAVPAVQDFGLCGWPCACRGLGGRGGSSAHRERPFGRDAETCGMYRWLRDNGVLEGCKGLVPVLQRLQGHGRTVHARAATQPEQ
jgi:hypothetical protein